MTFIYYFCIATFMFLCFLLCVVILMQESKSMGFGASFGGESSDLFGTSTAAVLKKFTAVLASIFLIFSVMLSLWTSSLARQKVMTPTSQIEESHDV